MWHVCSFSSSKLAKFFWMTYIANASGTSFHISSAHLRQRQLHETVSCKFILTLCWQCRASCVRCVSFCSLPSGILWCHRSLLIPHASAAHTCMAVNAPKVNPQPMWDRTQWVNAPACCPLGGQFWGIVHTSQVVPNGSSPHCLKLGSLVMLSYFGFSFFFLIPLVPLPMLPGSTSQEITCTQGLVSGSAFDGT